MPTTNKKTAVIFDADEYQGFTVIVDHSCTPNDIWRAALIHLVSTTDDDELKQLDVPSMDDKTMRLRLDSFCLSVVAVFDGVQVDVADQIAWGT